MLHVTKVTLELRFLRGYRCEEGAQGVDHYCELVWFHLIKSLYHFADVFTFAF